jgi:hypothetical protein
LVDVDESLSFSDQLPFLIGIDNIFVIENWLQLTLVWTI